ncbi:MAG: hypothetical protein IT371_31690 [Deltaproteobacteria bacterium]|nr:hypothetical protein [Deltaproteobacteria bacterium]
MSWFRVRRPRTGVVFVRLPRTGVVFAVALLGACGRAAVPQTSETSVVVPDPPWSSPACYGKVGRFDPDPSPGPLPRTFTLKDAVLPYVAGIAGFGDRGDEITHLRARVVSIRPYPRGPRRLLLGDVVLREPFRAEGDVVGGLNEHEPWELADPSGQTVVLTRSTKAPDPVAVPDAPDSHGLALRNTDEQLLTAVLHGTLKEYGRAAVPELTVTALDVTGPREQKECRQQRDRFDTFEPVRLRIASANDHVDLAQMQGGILKIGCVEYAVQLGYALRRVTKHCFDRTDLIMVHVTRLAMLTKAED